MEFQFENFQVEYDNFKQIVESILSELHNPETTLARRVRLTSYFEVIQNLDVKARLAFGIREIRLNDMFVSNKEGELKECHLLYYKLADLWFAYETYIKLVVKDKEKQKDKILWLDQKNYSSYSSSNTIQKAINTVSEKFASTYGNLHKRSQLITYLNHCKQESKGAQEKRLSDIILDIQGSNFELSHTAVLTVIYSVRNNFVHNGETTVVPDNFGYRNKAELLKILYPYLCIILLKSANTTLEII